jgi:hypothetical protein
MAMYSHWFAKRSEGRLGARLEAFVMQENGVSASFGNSTQPQAAYIRVRMMVGCRDRTARSARKRLI